MSGHSKWANIKNRKGAQDKKRSETFTKMAKNILVAVRENGGNTNPETNSALRAVIEKAKAASMPKENIERLLSKFEERKANLVTMTLEGFALGGVPLVIETETDNKNRTLAEIRLICRNHGANLGEANSVAFLFDRLGEIVLETEIDEEKQLELIDLGGVVDISGREIIVEPASLGEVRKVIEERGMGIEESGLVMKAKNPVMLASEDEVAKILDLVEELEDHDDVISVYTGFDYGQKV